MRVLLFGGAGYIGTHVALAFQQRNDTVGIFDDLSTGLKENIPQGVRFYKGSIMDRATVATALSDGWDVVVHLAAFKAAGDSMVHPELYAHNNISGSLNLITECIAHNVKHFILSSSAAVYGEPSYLPIDENHEKNPENYYGYTKLAIEENLSWFAKLKDFSYVSLRYFNAAGYDIEGKMRGLERNPANLIPVVMEVATGKRRELQIFGTDYPTDDGTGVRDYVHVTDLAEAHILAAYHLQHTHESLVVNLGSEHGLSVLQIVEATRRITGKNIPVKLVERRAGDPAKLVASSAKAFETLGWKAKFSDLETIVSSTWNVYKDVDDN